MQPPRIKENEELGCERGGAANREMSDIKCVCEGRRVRLRKTYCLIVILHFSL